MATITYPATYQSLAQIGNDVCQAGVEAGLSGNEIYDVQVAMDEACANIIEHGYGGKCNGTITCIYTILNNGLKITLKDQGCGFDADEITEPDLQTDLAKRKERGLGVFFMRKLMDEVVFQPRSDDGNTLVMVKYRKGSE